MPRFSLLFCRSEREYMIRDAEQNAIVGSTFSDRRYAAEEALSRESFPEAWALYEAETDALHDMDCDARIQGSYTLEHHEASIALYVDASRRLGEALAAFAPDPAALAAVQVAYCH